MTPLLLAAYIFLACFALGAGMIALAVCYSVSQVVIAAVRGWLMTASTDRSR